MASTIFSTPHMASSGRGSGVNTTHETGPCHSLQYEERRKIGQQKRRKKQKKVTKVPRQFVLATGKPPPRRVAA